MRKLKNLRVKEKAIAMTLAGTLATATLTGCGSATRIQAMEVPSYNKAIIFGDNTATIVEIEGYLEQGGGYLITTKDGLILTTSEIDTKLVDDSNSDIKAEDIAISVMGDDVQINYLGQNNSDNLTKTR